MWGLSRCCIEIWSELKWEGLLKRCYRAKIGAALQIQLLMIWSLKKGDNHLAELVIESPCPCDCLSVCLSAPLGAVFFRPLNGPDILNVSPWILFAFNIMWQIALVAVLPHVDWNPVNVPIYELKLPISISQLRHLWLVQSSYITMYTLL